MQFMKTVAVVVLAGATLSACSTYRDNLTAVGSKNWKLTTISSQEEALEESKITLEFTAYIEDRLRFQGTSECAQFFGAFKETDEGTRTSAFSTSIEGCTEVALSDNANQFLELMQSVTDVDFSSDRLTLVSTDGVELGFEKTSTRLPNQYPEITTDADY